MDEVYKGYFYLQSNIDATSGKRHYKKKNKHTNILFCYDQMTCCSDHFARNPGIDKSFIYNSINAEQFTASRKDATKYD